MPLKVMDVVELRLRVIADVEAGLSPREAAARHKIGKTQVYEWLARYWQAGAEGLLPRSRRPLRCPGQLAAAIEDEIVRWRKAKPRWGAKKIRSMLARDGWTPLPAVSTVHQVLVRRGLVEHAPRRREPPGGWQRFVRPHCNDLWHIDATQHRLANGHAFWVIDIIDDHSRFLLATHACLAPTCEAGWAALRAAVAAYGLPRQVLSDNGLNFTGRLHGMTVAFERQVRAAGIELIHARPYHPETIGKLERQHATQNAWLADHGAPVSLPAAQRLLDAYRADYNTTRPHRPLPRRLPQTPRQPQRRPPLRPHQLPARPPLGRHHRRPAPRPRPPGDLLRRSPHRYPQHRHPPSTPAPRTPTTTLEPCPASPRNVLSGMFPDRTSGQPLQNAS